MLSTDQRPTSDLSRGPLPLYSRQLFSQVPTTFAPMDRIPVPARWSGRFESLRLMPGDAIIAPPKIRAPGGFMEDLPTITQIVSQTAMTGAVISLLNS